MSMKNRLGPAALLAALLCSPAALAAQQTVTVAARDLLLSGQPARLFSVGAADGESWELFSSVRQVAFDARDNLYVLDGGNHRVIVFDARGKFLRQISKKGGGPGELLAPASLAVTTNGLIAIADLGRRGLSLFRPDGAFVHNRLFERGESTRLGIGAFRTHPRSGVVALTEPRGRARSQSGEGALRGERKAQVKWYDFGTGATLKTAQLHEFTLPPLIVKNAGERRAASGAVEVRTAVTEPVWQAQVSFGILPNGGIAFVHERAYRVKVANAQGHIERIITRPIAPRRATEKDRTLALEQRLRKERSETISIMGNGDTGETSITIGPPRRREPNTMRRVSVFEDFIPVIRRIDTDPQGRIWIARTPADLGQSGPIDLLRSDGSYIGTIANGSLPSAVSRSGRAAWIRRDELGVERIVVMSLPATWR
jgi:hypothetical protein